MTVNLSMLAGAGAQFFDNNGDPLSGGKVFTYAAGTTTPQATFTTNAGNVAHANPIVLDSAGRVPSGGEIWLTDSINYKFVLTNSTGTTIGTYDNLTGNGSGILSALTASGGSSLVGFIQAGSGAVATTVQTKLRQTVSIKDFGAVGDGVADDTTAIQAAIDSLGANGGTVIFPKPATYYLVSSLQMPTTGAVFLVGPGKEVPCLYGNGSSAVITTGTYPSSSLNDYRNLQYRDIRIENTNFPCIKQHRAVNFVVQNCALTTSGAIALDVAYSFRARIVGNRISTSGAFTALSCVDNCNGLVIEGNVITGGSAGNCINVEQSQGVEISNNIMETCGGFGISVSSETVTGAGNSSGVVVTGNYLESIRYPFKFGKETTVTGLVCRGNYVGNTNIATAGDYCFYLARVRNASIENNACSGKGTEYFIGFGYKVSSGITVLNDSTIKNNFINSFAGNYSIDSSMSGLESNMETVFGTNVIYFDATAPDIDLKTVQSAIYTSNVSSGGFVIIPATAEGGKIKYVDVYKNGTVNGRLRIGSTINASEIVDIADMSTLSYTGGHARLTLAGTRIRRSQPVYITLTTGAGTGTFYVVVGYKN